MLLFNPGQWLESNGQLYMNEPKSALTVYVQVLKLHPAVTKPVATEYSS